jgi:hypothetical protein
VIDLRATATELLLFVPASEKSRARSIQGYRWNPNRRCWVYPKTPSAYDAIVREFRTELPEPAVPRPDDAGHAIVTPAADQDQLLSDLERARDDLAAVRARVAELEREREVLQQERDAAIAEGASAGAGDHERFIRFFRGLAVDAAGRDRAFSRLAAGISDPELFPATARAELEASLRQLLHVTAPAATLADLAGAARDVSLLPAPAADIALALASLPDELAGAPVAVTWARCLFALYATALIWPALSAAGRRSPR